jgi:hypothetical protein
MKVIMKVDSKNLHRRLKRIQEKIDTNGTATVKDIARKVQVTAQILAPKDTGQLAKFIKITPLINTKERKEYTVGFDNQGFGSGNPHPGRTWGSGEFSLPFWMQPDVANPDSKKAKNHFKSGDRAFLFRSAQIIRPEFKSRTVRVVKDALQIKVK